VDWAEHKPEVDSLIEGTFSGTITDGEEGREPCAVTGLAYLLSLEVSDPVACGDREGHEEDSGSDCSSSVVASFPISGVLSLDGVEIGEITGSVHAESYDGGVSLDVNLSPPPGDYPRQNFDPGFEDDGSGDRVLESFSWDRRLSEDDAPETIWELCLLPVETREP
jgi:hypothetical protein